MIATIKAFDASGKLCHEDTRDYPDISLLWEHIGAQQNNRRTMRVKAVTDTGVEYDVEFSVWTPARIFPTTRRFQAFLKDGKKEA
jgi:hypothetical protein